MFKLVVASDEGNPCLTNAVVANFSLFVPRGNVGKVGDLSKVVSLLKLVILTDIYTKVRKIKTKVLRILIGRIRLLIRNPIQSPACYCSTN